MSSPRQFAYLDDMAMCIEIWAACASAQFWLPAESDVPFPVIELDWPHNFSVLIKAHFTSSASWVCVACL
eukprot:1060672-Amphidinium_carterae.1